MKLAYFNKRSCFRREEINNEFDKEGFGGLKKCAEMMRRKKILAICRKR